MKKLVLLISAFITMNLTILAEETENKIPQIIVDGSAETIVDANRASFSINFKGFGSTLEEAVKAANESAQEVSKIAKSFGIKGVEVSTFDSRESNNKLFLSGSKDYKSFITVNITVDSLILLEGLILKLSKMKDISISDITYSLKNPEEIKYLTLMKAVEAAKSKADGIVKITGAKIKKLMYFSENSMSDFNIRGGRANVVNFEAGIAPFNSVSDKSSSGEYFSKKMYFSKSVHLVFELE